MKTVAEEVSNWLNALEALTKCMEGLGITRKELARETGQRQPDMSVMFNIAKAKEVAPVLKALIKRGGTQSEESGIDSAEKERAEKEARVWAAEQARLDRRGPAVSDGDALVQSQMNSECCAEERESRDIIAKQERAMKSARKRMDRGRTKEEITKQADIMNSAIRTIDAEKTIVERITGVEYRPRLIDIIRDYGSVGVTHKTLFEKAKGMPESAGAKILSWLSENGVITVEDGVPGFWGDEGTRVNLYTAVTVAKEEA